jgi:long-subunit acyl-CoA synthetase (AMP-forming)
MAKTNPKQRMLIDPVHGNEVVLNYGQFRTLVTTLAAAFQKLGLKASECVSIFSENSYKWLVVDQAVMKVGAPRCYR